MTTQPVSADIERQAFLHDALAVAEAIAVGERLGVFQCLDSGPVDATTLAQRCSISQRGADALMAALASIGLAEADVSGAYQMRASGFWLDQMRTHWQYLENAVRTGEPDFPGDDAAVAGSRYADIVGTLGVLFQEAAERCAVQLTRPGMRVLDLGAGAAPWSIALARRDATNQVVALDLAPVLSVTRQAAIDAGVSDCFIFEAGDVFGSDFPPNSYDLALLANLCHLFEESANQRLLERVFGSVKPGGRLAIIDVLPNEDFRGPRSAIMYNLGLLLRTGSGRAYTFSTYAAWLRDCGFREVTRTDLASTPPLSVIVANRPFAE